ncbi:hypothetical protein Vi05172_g12173 [Venturia inaequalis]|uniref:Mitochondrial carrier protein pet8 protein n=1 Tax=Venturia inaequalis TaxID=5025 RepID=A0A8H3UG46_VENIN|nr:hypothetical protein EG327_010659 [Venturia inaequalis]RDI77834.1 hypothetical protein Vi05172_g12173 [Venturia inaequalis]
MPLRLSSSFRTSVPRLSTSIRPTQYRSFTTANRLSIKEDANRTGEQLEAKKQEQLDKQKRGEGHWHEELASAGESNIRADKEKVEDHDEHIEDLQKQTEEAANKGKV